MSPLLQDYLTLSAESNPQRLAVAMGEDRLTYGDIELESNRLARLLAEVGCRPGHRVCLLLPKSPAAIVGMIAALKAGAAYVPIDVASPAPRVTRILRVCEPRIVLACGETTALADELVAEGALSGDAGVAFVDDSADGESFRPSFRRTDWATVSADPLSRANRADGLAHLLFTSGSTGVPKGVMITHSNVARFVTWATSYFDTQSSDRISGHPPLHFDLSTFDIYGTFLAGAELHLVPPATNLQPDGLVEFIRANELTQWFSVPSALTFMAKYGTLRYGDFPHLKRLIWCGEVLPTPTLIEWMRRLPHVTFTNLYGPTEATIASSYYTVPDCPADPTAQIPIGQACAGEELAVLDKHMKPIPQGEIGEVYIGGAGLSPGYWRDEEKTAAVFRPHPASNETGARLYRTGDLGRVGEDGLVYFLGRADSQIKSRGYRIELGEIETALNAHPGLEECAVVGVDTSGFEGTAICCAYAPLDGEELTHAQLRSHLAQVLPSYMLPSQWLLLDALPKNLNGKIDRPRLRERFKRQAEGAAAKQDQSGSLIEDPPASRATPEHVAVESPDGSLARRLTGLPEEEWHGAVLAIVQAQLAGLLGCPLHAMEPERTFKDLGVDSLASVELRNRLGSATGLRLPMTLLFDHPTVGSVARFLLCQVKGDQGGDPREARVRRTLASIPLARLRSAGLLDVLLELADSPNGHLQGTAGEEERADAIESLDVEALVQRALDVGRSRVERG